MEEITTFVNTNLIPHWPFFGFMVICMIVVQVVKANVFTKTAHRERKPVWLFWWGRKTLALHPIVLGAILGIFWRKPEVGVDKIIASMTYFALSGGLSVWAYEFLKGIAKKEGIDLSLPGVDESVPPSDSKAQPNQPPTPPPVN